MSKYRKKPVVVEAVRIKATDINDDLMPDGWPFEGRPDWLVKAVNEHRILPHKERESDYFHAAIRTAEGTMIGSPGDWIIRGVQGELYPRKPDIFEATYEPAESS